MPSAAIHQALIDEVLLRLYDESLPRILQCLESLNDQQIWWRPNEASNSIGNLVLHLCGNVRQWIGSGLGDLADHRKRQTEFDERTPLAKEKLIHELLLTMSMAKSIISEAKESDLLRKRSVQTFEESGISILIHVTEHFSYHTGQIAYITKMLLAQPLGFYEGIPLE